MYKSPRSHVQSTEIICTIRRDHMYNPPRSYIDVAEIICTIRRGRRYNSPRSHVSFAEITFTLRRDHMLNSPRSLVDSPRTLVNSPKSCVQAAEIIAIQAELLARLATFLGHVPPIGDLSARFLRSGPFASQPFHLLCRASFVSYIRKGNHSRRHKRLKLQRLSIDETELAGEGSAP